LNGCRSFLYRFGERARVWALRRNNLGRDNPWASLPNLRIWIRNDWRVRRFGSCRINVTIRSKVRRRKRISRHYFTQTRRRGAH
jgi:hypothetical protein